MSSDSDSDWDDEITNAPVTTAEPAATVSAAATPAAASTAAPTAAAPPSVVLALPITLSLKGHPALGQGIPAGVTLLYDAGKNALTLLAYDAHKRPMLLLPFDGAKLVKSSLPFSLALGDGDGNSMHLASIADAQARTWTLSFGTPQEATRMACHIGLASLIARAAAKASFNQIFIRHELAKGAGKSCTKAKSFVTLQLRVWSVDLTSDPSVRGTAAFSQITSNNTLTTFHPDLTIGGDAPTPGTVPFTTPIVATTLNDVEVVEESSSSLACPTAIGEALASGKLKTEGGSRLYIVPGSSDFVRDVLTAAEAAPLPRDGEGSLVLIQLTPLSVSKKKSKAEKKSKSKADNVEATEITVDASPAASPTAAESMTASPAAASTANPLESWSRELSPLVASLIPSLETMNAHVTSLPSIQQKILKSVMTELYDGLVQDLSLQAALDAQSTAADEAATAPTVDPTQAAHLAAIQTRVRGLVASYVERNTTLEHRGTLAQLVQAWKTELLPAIGPLVNPDGLLGEARLRALTAAAASAGGGGNAANEAKLSKQVASQTTQLKKLEEANRALQEKLDQQMATFKALDTKHTKLVMQHVDMEEENAKLQVSQAELQKKATMCTVFETAVTDMRGMLENEIMQKNQLQEAMSDLTRLQKAYKLTWVPEKAVTHCMKCQAKFSMFGKSKGHCRYCGRVFCSSKECTTECTIPEFGYTSKVKICRPCFAFRSKVQGEAAAEAAAEAEEDTAAANNNSGGGGTVLSYDSDVLDD